MVFNKGIKELSPELRLLLICAQGFTEPDDKLDTIITPQIDWDLFIGLAIHHRVYPLIYKSLSRLNNNVVPSHVINTLQQAYRKNTLIAVNMAGEMVRVLNCFIEKGVKSLILKGSPLALKLYGDINLRPSKDIDILVDPKDLEIAAGILEEQGYSNITFDWTMTPRQEKSYLEKFHHLVFYNTERNVYLELHWKLHGFGLRALCLANIEQTDVEMAGCIVPVMQDEMWLMYLIIHGCWHRWFRLRWLCDIDRFIRLASIDWDKLKFMFDKSGSNLILHQTIILLHILCNLTVPDSIVKAVHADKKAWKQAISIIEQLSTRIDININHNSYWKNFMINNGYRLQLCSGWGGKLNYISAIFQPIKEDFKAIDLPDSLYPLYYLIRPLTWLNRRTGNSMRKGYKK